MQPEEARARMLRLWVALSAPTNNSTGKNSNSSTVSILTTQRTVVHADALVPNAKQTLFAATNLVTPLGRYAHAVLRDQDVALIERHITPEQLCTLLQHEHHAT